MKRVLFLSLVFIVFTAFECRKENPRVTNQVGDVDFGNVGTGSGCTNLTYNGPTNDAQIESWCRLAQAYKCQGNTAGVQQLCQYISDFGGSCPYC